MNGQKPSTSIGISIKSFRLSIYKFVTNFDPKLNCYVCVCEPQPNLRFEACGNSEAEAVGNCVIKIHSQRDC